MERSESPISESSKLKDLIVNSLLNEDTLPNGVEQKNNEILSEENNILATHPPDISLISELDKQSLVIQKSENIDLRDSALDLLVNIQKAPSMGESDCISPDISVNSELNKCQVNPKIESHLLAVDNELDKPSCDLTGGLPEIDANDNDVVEFDEADDAFYQEVCNADVEGLSFLTKKIIKKSVEIYDLDLEDMLAQEDASKTQETVKNNVEIYDFDLDDMMAQVDARKTQETVKNGVELDDIAQEDACKIPGLSYIISSGSDSSFNLMENCFDCVLCTYDKEQPSLLFSGPDMRSHGRSRYHVINAMRVENFALYEKYKCDTQSTLASLLHEILDFEAIQAKQTVFRATKETYPLIRKKMINKINWKISIHEFSKIQNPIPTMIAANEPAKTATAQENKEKEPEEKCDKNTLMHKIALLYRNNVQTIAKWKSARVQNNIVLVTDERDNFENQLAGCDRRLTVLQVPGLKLENAFDKISSHPSFRKGTIFIFSCGIHDLLQSFVLPSCTNFNCVNPQIMLSLPPACNSTHSLILKALHLNMQIIQTTSNDFALFVGMIPVNVNQYNDFSLKMRQCYLFHTADQIPTVEEHRHREFIDTISLYNYFVKYHAQTLGYDPWDLETPYYKRSISVLQTNGYNMGPQEEVLRVREARKLSVKLLSSFSSEIKITRNEGLKIFVRPLTSTSTNTSLHNYFMQYGTVDSITLKKMATGDKFMAFVEFSHPSAVDMVLAIKNHMIDGSLANIRRFVKQSPSEEVLDSASNVNINQSSVCMPPVPPQTAFMPAQSSVSQDSTFRKYPINLLMDVKLHYEQTLVEIMQFQKGRSQSTIVIITDERDNLDMTLVGFEPRVYIMKFPNLNFDNILATVEKTPYFGKGTIFIVSCGIHDLLQSFFLPECLTAQCLTPQTILSILPANYDHHYLNKKAIKFNKELLRATQNDIALFCGVIPVHVDQYNICTISNRPCGSAHFANSVPLVDMTQLNFLYKQSLIWFNNFTKFHAQMLGCQPWDLELPYYANSSVNILLPNGYNVFPEEEFRKANEAKILLSELLKTLVTPPQIPILFPLMAHNVEAKATMASQIYVPFPPMVHNVEVQAAIATQNVVNQSLPSTSYIPSNFQVNPVPSSYPAISGDHHPSSGDMRLARGIINARNISSEQAASKFSKVFFVGRRDLVDPLLKCDIYSSIICHNFSSYLEEETSSLLKKLEFIPERSLCSLVFDLSVIAKPLISPECSKKCKRPLSISSLKARTTMELYDLVFSRLQLIAKCIERLASHLPVIILPLTPSRLYCQDEVLHSHDISHTISVLGVNVVRGSQHLWREAVPVLMRSWTTFIEMINRKYDPSNYLSNYDSSSYKSFPIIDDVTNILPHWHEPGNWKEFINRYVSSLSFQLYNGNVDEPPDYRLTKSMFMPKSFSCERPKSLTRSRRDLSSFSNEATICNEKSRSTHYLKKKRSRSKSTSFHDKYFRSRSKERHRKGSQDRYRSKSAERKSQSKIEASDQHERKSRSSSIDAREQMMTDGRSTSPLAEDNSMNIQALEAELSEQLGHNLFLEYTSQLDVMRLSFEEEFEVFKSVPELHPDYDKYYETFSIHYHKQYGSVDRKHKEVKWKIFWKSNFNTIKADDWQLKHLSLIKEYQVRGAQKRSLLRSEMIGSQAFVFEEALTLISNLSESITFLGPAVSSMIGVCRDLGTNTKAAFDVFTEPANIAIINLIKEKFKNLSQSAADDRRFSYQMAVDWIPKLLDEAKRGPPTSQYESNNKSNSIDLNAIAKLSLGKGTEYALDLINMALDYEGVNKPSKEFVNELYLKVCRIHFSLAMK